MVIRKESAGNVMVSMISSHKVSAGSIPSPALQTILIRPIPLITAKTILEHSHYLHSFPGGTKLTFGTFVNHRLLGAITLGCGPFLAYHLVDNASPEDCLTLTRLWLSDELPRNSESRVLGIIIRTLRHNTNIKFLVSYSDPAAGHIGIIYQATGWLYTGRSSAMPLYDLGDGHARHSRSLAHTLGSHSTQYFADHGIDITLIPQKAKHRYIYFLNPSWKQRLNVPVLPYPRKEY